jgi:hypothetical protein
MSPPQVYAADVPLSWQERQRLAEGLDALAGMAEDAAEREQMTYRGFLAEMLMAAS